MTTPSEETESSSWVWAGEVSLRGSKFSVAYVKTHSLINNLIRLLMWLFMFPFQTWAVSPKRQFKLIIECSWRSGSGTVYKCNAEKRKYSATLFLSSELSQINLTQQWCWQRVLPDGAWPVTQVQVSDVRSHKLGCQWQNTTTVRPLMLPLQTITPQS